MLSVSIVRAKCYLILQGLERSLSDIIVKNYNLEDPTFFTSEEQERALRRLREDMEETEWTLNDVMNDDLLVYLDLGDLVHLLNRHKSVGRNVLQDVVDTTTNVIQTYGLQSIRKRVMHPVRPIEAEDFPNLIAAANELQINTKTFDWKALDEGLQYAEDPETSLGVSLPSYWTEDSPIVHNLPVAEFDDTGFIGRKKERRQLKQLIDSDHNVITVVGEGGIGKTALVLRVCHDILEDSESKLERIVWVSLKTQYLTSDGIQNVIDAIETPDALVDRLLSGIESSNTNEKTDDITETWDKVIEQMKVNNILLVIDNLETLGHEIRELAINTPRNSKLLMTSRVGLGEIELRYEMPRLSPKDAGLLLRHLGVVYNYDLIVKLDNNVIVNYCKMLHYNPLLIKWFVQAVGNGAHPDDVLAYDELGDALRFCWENVYEGLSPLSIEVISTLLASRRSLSQPQLQELLGAHRITLLVALHELHQSNVIQRQTEGDGGVVFQIGSLVFDYLSRYHPPTNESVLKTRNMLRQWQTEQERSTFQKNTYRYGRNVILIDSNDEKLAALHLRKSLNMMKIRDLDSARSALLRAQELTPQWWEIHRIKAALLQLEDRPIYEVEQSFEESINCRSTDVNRFHYSVYLMRNEEYDKALEHIEIAMIHPEADEISLRSIRGLVLLRNSRIDEAIGDLKFVWDSEGSRLPSNIKRIHGTQYSDAIRRRVEQQFTLGNSLEAQESALEGLKVVDRAAADYGWDKKLAEVGIETCDELLRRNDLLSATETEMFGFVGKWKNNIGFGISSANIPEATEVFRKFTDEILNNQESPIDQTEILPDDMKQGIVRLVKQWFGFITSEDHEDVHMDWSSLAPSTSWRNLRVGQTVVFATEIQEKGAHAVRLEIKES